MGLERRGNAGIERCEGIELELCRVMGQERGQGGGKSRCRLGAGGEGVEEERARGGGEDGGGLVADGFKPRKIAPPGLVQAAGEGSGGQRLEPGEGWGGSGG